MSNAFDCAVRLLARRDYSVYELTGKILQKGYSQEDTESAIAECQRLGLQSDSRFAEMICNARVRQGYGPLRIVQELQGKQVSRDIINAALAEYESQWQDYACAVWRKKFKQPINFAEQQKQQRFLLYRGFSADIIAGLFKEYC
ncbi:recombination regulator RecX [Legionella dresdenensis]|uniref:Regulatory protein RecX n=1 Tax=Legionella dresdenensis TaxID=450200 RepID=A0ABV8CEU5_9GAMM